MSRRISLPGADELFRTTGTASGAAAAPEDGSEPAPGQASGRSMSVVPDPESARSGAPQGDVGRASPAGSAGGGPAVRQTTRPRAHRGDERRPSGRERHDEKITVYLSPEELIDLERARLTLRQDSGLAVDRGRIVREAVALVLAELEAKGDHSTLVKRLRGV
jgi:hypothetical protein